MDIFYTIYFISTIIVGIAFCITFDDVIIVLEKMGKGNKIEYFIFGLCAIFVPVLNTSIAIGAISNYIRNGKI